MYIKDINADLLKIDTSQMIEVDRLMMEDYKIGLIQMMENAGRCLAIVAREEFLSQDPEDKAICVLAGTGGNSGGAMVCARRLSAWGAKVSLYVSADSSKMTKVPRHQYEILERMGIDIHRGDALEDDINFDLIIDGVIGYSINGNPYGIAKYMIDWANNSRTKVLSLDSPSGLDLTTGWIHTPTISADATVTLAMPKKGLFGEAAKEKVGQLYLGDISVPLKLYSENTLNLNSENIFRYSDILRIV